MRNNAKRDSPQQQNGEWKSASYSAGTANAIMDPVEQLFNTPTKMRTGMTSGTPSRVSPFSRNDSIGSPSLPKMDSTKIRSLLHFRRKEAAGGTPTSNSPSASTASHGGVASLPAAASPHQTSSSPTPHAAGSGGAEGGRPVISATVSRTRYVRENGPRLGQQQRGSGFNDTQQSNNSGSFSSSSPLYATLLREQEEKIMSASGRSNGRGDSPGKAEFYRSLTPNRSQGNSPRNRTPQQRRTSEALRSAAEVARGARKRPVLEGLTRCQNLAEVYAEACKALNLRPNSVLQRTFPTRRGEFIEKIDLSINYVGAKGLQPLFYVMEENRDHLMHLNLSSNNLENTEVLELLEVLCGEAGERLSSLDLSYNPISQSGGQAIYRLIKARPNLVNVQLKGTLIPPRLLQSIVENVEENSYRQHIGV